MAIGYIRVEARDKGGELPVAGSNITITDKNGAILFNHTTDHSGDTQNVALYAPEKSRDGLKLYETYNITVSKPGFVTQAFVGAKVYDGEVSAQSAKLTPIIAGMPETNYITALPQAAPVFLTQPENAIPPYIPPRKDEPAPAPIDKYAYPGEVLQWGCKSGHVKIMQDCLNVLANRYPSISRLNIDSYFGANTQSAVLAFQKQFGIKLDGVIGEDTWNQIITQRKIALSNPIEATAETKIKKQDTREIRETRRGYRSGGFLHISIPKRG